MKQILIELAGYLVREKTGERVWDDLIFLEKEQGLDKRHTSITAIKAYSNAIEIQYGSKTYNIFLLIFILSHK